MFDWYFKVTKPLIFQKEILRALEQNDQPPTLLALMNSKINFGKPDDEKVKIIDLPSAFREYLFDFDYPLDSELKESFEENFLTHYMMRRIGFETYMAFKIQLKAKLNEIMPKYGLLLENLQNMDFDGIKETHTRNITATSTSNGVSNNTSDNRYSDTPQNQLASVQNGTYVTDYTYNQQSGTSSASGLSNSSETINITKGDSTDEYIKFQERVISIYTLIYKELDSLFYGII